MTRLLPDPDLLVLEVVRGAVGPDVQVGTDIPADLLDRLPFVTILLASGDEIHPEFALRATYDVQVWAEDRQTASDLAETVRAGLYFASKHQTVYTGGHVAYYRALALPAEIDSGYDNVRRFQASYSLALRP